MTNRFGICSRRGAFAPYCRRHLSDEEQNALQKSANNLKAALGAGETVVGPAVSTHFLTDLPRPSFLSKHFISSSL
jgi:hypothetical protein